MRLDRQAPSPPPPPASLLSARQLAFAWSVMASIALLAWVLVVDQARDMGVEPGTMGMDVPLFLLLWLVMMIAMMFPSVAPVALTWARAIGRRSPTRVVRVTRTAQFVGGYLLTWTAFGLIAYGLLAGTGALVDEHPGAGRWIGAGAFLVAGLYQF
ncbi:DUF2182 domain-containing protein, partial [Streptomyces sp. NPDC004579]|uniref:copper chaperone n=1 Tax=Streptomyces sp. NPDC004579 TaxID=3154667 RepID=UPI00339F1843